MAKEWYLLKSPYNQLSGFEEESLTDFGEEGFLEILDSDYSDEIEICNYDLSERKKIRAVVQNNVQDTKLKTLSRAVFVPIGTCAAGMYVYYDGRYWLIVGIVGNNKIYEKAIVSFCNYKLTWLNSKGDIVQRWACIESASQYNNGETGFRLYFVRSDQLLISIPDDDECLSLDSGKRFVIDRRTELYERSFDSTVTVSTSNPLAVYDLTRSDSVLYDYQNSGIFEFLATQTEQRNDDGYYVIDGSGYWLAEKPRIYTSETSNPYSKISSDSDVIYIGIEPIICTARFYDSYGEEQASIEPNWIIETDNPDQLDIEYYGKSISIATGDNSLSNKTIRLILNNDGYDLDSKLITIKPFI